VDTSASPETVEQPHSRRIERDGWHLGLELPPKQTVSQWADAKRYIAAGTGPEAGRWRTDRTPYLRGPMDALADADIETVVLMMSSQVGKTEVLINAACYFIDQDPSPQMLVLPSLELADSFSTKRFTPTIEASPSLLDRIGPQSQRTTSNTIREKSYPGGDIVFAGANSPSSLASRPRRVVMLDEIDKYKANIGDDGDPIRQAFQRTQNFWNRKRLLASTPTLEGLSVIDAWFKRSDQRQFECPCHACGSFQALEWEQVKWQRGKPDTARYVCEHCEAEWDQRQVYLAVRHGHWVAQAPYTGVAGFRCWAIYSPWVGMADLAAEWEDAEGKPTEEQTFVNLKLGRPYNPTRGAKTTPEALFARREDYGPTANGGYRNLPAGVLLVTAHVDVQHDRWECQYIGHGIDDERWVLDYRVFYADTHDQSQWALMDAHLLARTFPHPSGRDLQIEAVAVDAGDQQQRVLEFVRESRMAFKPYYAVRGVGGEGRPLFRESEQKFKLGSRLHLSGVDDGKRMVFADVAAGPSEEHPQARVRVHFPNHLEIDYFRGLIASEKLKVEFVGGWPKRKWVPVTGVRNEPLDTFVGAVAVRYALSVDFQARAASMKPDFKPTSFAGIANLFKKG
jgi:phage terminase large subunit GpA-like protein